ncbi:restriction endonuclease subunit S [Rhodanobacter sp. BL-MT-08]
MSLARYLDYKASGLPWLGEIPTHWQVVQSRRYFSERKERAVDRDRQLTASQKYGVLYQDIFTAIEGQKVVQVILGADILKHVEPNDFVISMRSFQGGIEWCPFRGSISSAYVMLIPSAQIDAKFFRYLFKSVPYIQALQSTTNLVRDGQAMRFSNFAQVDLPLLPTDEQAAIAAFLDRETGKIDALIAEQEKLLTLLAEKRQATISHAVTRGLNPNAPMKDSGVPWLGEVPAHWLIGRIKHVISSIEQGWSPQCENYPAETSEEWGVLKVGCVNGGVFRPSENKRLPDELEPMSQYALRQGDLLISRANARDLVGGAAVVTEDHPKLLLCDKLYRLRMDGAFCLAEFLAALLGADGARSQIELHASGASSSMLNIGQSVILDMPVALPPIEEQFRIVAFIGMERHRLDELQCESKHAIDLLKERRSALIAAAVTGKIDVRSTSQTKEEACA